MKKAFLKALSLVLVAVMLAGEFAMTVTAEETTASDTSTTPVTYTSADLKDYSMPSDQKHAYDPFAQLESEEATAAYRETVQYEAGTIIYKVSQTKGWFGGYKDVSDTEALSALGIDVANAEELSRKEVDDGFFTDTYEVIYVAALEGDVWEAVDALAQTEGVVDAQPNYLYEDTAIDVPTIVHNPNQDKQWHHGPDHLECDKHWQHLHDEGITPGEGSIVAVIDTGVDYTHPDLMANMWVNTAEYFGTPGVDDDGNGYIDDIHGASTVGASYFHSGDPMDDNGHGTHVAGIIAMTPNNDIGAAGLAYGAKIMAIKAGQATGVFSDTDIAEAINYAVAMGADVINMSFSGTGKSFLVEEALANAFGSCVLVAAAGNNGIPTADAPAWYFEKADFYPAGYSYVIGVMATDESGNLADFSNWDYIPNGGTAEYEIVAPGVDIFSTLPGGQYASWDGTSMAAPVVSAAAALLRSKYSDKDVYSSRFIMGQLVSATEDACRGYPALNLDDSLNKLPTPNINVKNVYFFDDPSIDPANDGDGIIDAGETIEMGIVLRNQWGLATDVTVTVDAISVGGVPNPNIQWITDTIDMEDVGTFNEQNNSFVYENDALVDTANPIKFKVSADTINDANIGFNINIYCRNGLDSADSTAYNFKDNPDGFDITFFVQRGRTISGTIREDLTMTSEDYWIVENAVYIPEGVTVTVEPGTQIQFWGTDASSPYAAATIAYIEVDGQFLVQGTEEEPVEMFPSAAFQDYTVDIRGGLDRSFVFDPNCKTTGDTRLSYVNIINPQLNFNYGDHLNIVKDSDTVYYRYLNNGIVYTESMKQIAGIIVQKLTDSVITNIYTTTGTGHSFTSTIRGKFEHVLFENCYAKYTGSVGYTSFALNDSVVLGSNTFVDKYNKYGLNVEAPYEIQDSLSLSDNIYTYDGNKYIVLSQSGLLSGGTYYLFNYMTLNQLAVNRGGTIACINSDEEMNAIFEMLKNEFGGVDTYVTVGHYQPAGSDSFISLDGSVSDLFSNSILSDDLYGCLKPSYASTDTYIRSKLILEFPDTVSDEELKRAFSTEELINAALAANEEYGGYPLENSNNAILNSFVDNDGTLQWNKFVTDLDASYIVPARNNYWGTDNQALIRAQAIDGDTYGGLADIVTEPYLTLESPELENIYPFVTEAYITDSEGNVIDTCGYQEIQLHVKFNRDMDTSVLPMVSFGPAEPYTDHVVDGEFVDARHWVGTVKVTPIIDAGTEYIRIKDAAAANDGWLKTGTDEARFAFEISSTSAEALVLQAVGSENRVDLTWMQDDYATLAGFNIYRSTSIDGEYEKLNTTLVPGTIREFTDTNVEPGVEYFYYFTVMGTDLIESNGSNVASATPIDNIKPILDHTRVTSAGIGQAIALTATASDNIGVEYVKIFYRVPDSESWKTVNMSLTENGNYFGVIGANEVTAAGIEYYVEVSDGTSVIREGSAAYPIEVSVDYFMAIYNASPSKVDVSEVSNGITALLTGVNFSESMTLTVAGKPVEYTYISENQISFIIPEGNLGRADVVLTDGDRHAQLTNAITYTDGTADVQIASPGIASAGVENRFPVTVSANGDVYGVDLTLKLDSDLYGSVSFEKNQNIVNGQASYNYDWNGTVKISVASSDVIDTDAPIGYLILIPKAVEAGKSATVEISSAKINAVTVDTLVDCNFEIRSNFSVSGRITYYNSGAGIGGVKVSLSNGATTYTDENGYYIFNGVTQSRVTVTPELSGSVNNAVSSQDAAMVLFAITGEGSWLTDAQFTAADVDGDGHLTALDAAYILQKTVGKLSGNYPGTGAEWTFSGANSLTLTGTNTVADFTGILLGDVTGDWTSNPETEIE